MWGLSDSVYKNTSIHDGLTWSEIIHKKKSLINKNGGQGDLVIAINIMIMKMPLNNSLQSIVSYTYMVVIPALDILRSMTKFKVRKYLIVLTSL